VNPRVSIQTQIEIKNDLNLTNIPHELNQINPPKKILKSALRKPQNDLVLDLCKPEYEITSNRKFSRAGTTSKTLLTKHNKIEQAY